MNIKDPKNQKPKDLGDSMEKSIQATRYLMNMKSGDLTAEDNSELNEWLAENPENQAELKTMDMLWDFTEIFREHPMTQKDLKKGMFSKSTDLLKGWAEKLWERRPRVYSLGVATASVLVLIGIWITQIHVPTQQTYHTATGEQRTLYLKDDLTVYLDTDTLILVNLTKERRYIELKKGHALFKVTNGAERSLVVTAGKYDIFDLGTEFNVKMDHEGKISVAVLTGRVEIVNKQEKQKPIIHEKQKAMGKKPVPVHKTIMAMVTKKPASIQNIILPGQEIIMDTKEKTYQIKTADTKGIDEWRNGRLYFDKEPLVNVLSEINRYLEKKIIISDESLNKLEITVNFKISERKYFLNTIIEILPLVAKKTINGQYALERKNDVR